MSENSIRVLVVDDHPVVRSGLRLLLDREEGVETVGEAGSGRDAIFEARSTNPDVILLDLVLREETGIDVLPRLLHEHPHVKVLFLSMQDDPAYVRDAFAGGAHGYVLKDAADAELVHAIREVAAGGRYVDAALGARLATVDLAEKRSAKADPLSEREHDVLRLLALGHTNSEIGRILFISVRTVESHRLHIMRKLGLQRRADLVQYALRHGVFEDAG